MSVAISMSVVVHQILHALLAHTAGVYVHSIATGDGTMADVSSTFFGNVNDQVWARFYQVLEWHLLLLAN